MSVRGIHFTFILCLVLLGLSYFLAYFDWGAWTLFLALCLSGVKALAVVLYFMELQIQKFMIQIIAPLTLAWAATFFVLLFADYLTRGLR